MRVNRRRFEVWIFIAHLLIIQSCISDNEKSKVLDSTEVTAVKEETPKVEKFQNPEIKSVSATVDFPLQENWVLESEFTIDDVVPSSVAYLAPDVYVSDTLQKLVLRYSLDGSRKDTIITGEKVGQLNQRVSRLIMPMIEKDTIFVYRGIRKFMKMEIPIKMNRPFAFDGYRIDDFVLVDQRNHRFFRRNGTEDRTIGKYGSGDAEFIAPQGILMVNGRVYVSDTGNNRLSIFDSDGTFITQADINGLRYPTSLTSDGNYIFLLDTGASCIRILSPSGDQLYTLTDHFENPTDIYFNDGRLYISDTKGATIKILYNNKYDIIDREN